MTLKRGDRQLNAAGGTKSIRPMPVPARVYFGAVFAGLAVAALVYLGVLGAALAPASEDFRFTRGVEFAPGEEARLRGLLADLASDPDRLVRIVGHSGVQGDSDANLDLSRARAARAEEIARDVGLPANRLLSITGVGGGAPLERTTDQTDREFDRSLSRVTIIDQAAP